MNMGPWILWRLVVASMQVCADCAVALSNFDREVWLAIMGGGGEEMKTGHWLIKPPLMERV